MEKGHTPPAYKCSLESIMLDIVADICQSEDEEIALGGTLAEIVPIKQADDFKRSDDSPVLGGIAGRFWNAVRNENPHSKVDLSISSQAWT